MTNLIPYSTTNPRIAQVMNPAMLSAQQDSAFLAYAPLNPHQLDTISITSKV